MTTYLVCDYTKTENGEDGKRKLYELSAKDLLELLERCRWDESKKVAVYEIGDCLLDWS